MLEYKTWILNENKGNHYNYSEWNNEEDLNFMVEFYKKFGWREFAHKYDNYDVLLYRPLDWEHTEFLGIRMI